MFNLVLLFLYLLTYFLIFYIPHEGFSITDLETRNEAMQFCFFVRGNIHFYPVTIIGICQNTILLTKHVTTHPSSLSHMPISEAE